jgi:ribonuclease P protein component
VVQENLSGNDHPFRLFLSKNEILRGDKQFQRLIREGKRVRAGDILCHYVVESITKQKPHPALRVGFSVPRQIVRKAVDRNRVKRLMREAYRTHKPMFSTYIHTNGIHLDLLFIYRGKSETKSRYLTLDDVKPDIVQCFMLLKEKIGGSEK